MKKGGREDPKGSWWQSDDQHSWLTTVISDWCFNTSSTETSITHSCGLNVPPTGSWGFFLASLVDSYSFVEGSVCRRDSPGSLWRGAGEGGVLVFQSTHSLSNLSTIQFLDISIIFISQEIADVKA